MAEQLIRSGYDLEILAASEPVGLAVIQYSVHQGRRRALPHFFWFQEASPRLRLELALRFLVDLKASNFVIVEAPAANWRFFDHLCCYGVLRRAGTLKHAYGEGQSAGIYQGVGSWAA